MLFRSSMPVCESASFRENPGFAAVFHILLVFHTAAIVRNSSAVSL